MIKLYQNYFKNPKLILHTSLGYNECIKTKKVKIEQFWGEQEPFQIGVQLDPPPPWCLTLQKHLGAMKVKEGIIEIKFEISEGDSA